MSESVDACLRVLAANAEAMAAELAGRAAQLGVEEEWVTRLHGLADALRAGARRGGCPPPPPRDSGGRLHLV